MSDQDNLYAQFTTKWHMNVLMPFKKADGSDITLPMVVLSGRESFEVKQKAEADTRASYGKDIPKKEETSDYDNRLKDHLTYWTLFYSIRRPDDLDKKVFPSKEALMDVIGPELAGILANDYYTVQIHQPWLTHLQDDDPEKIETMVQKLIRDGKDPSFFLNSLTLVAQNTLIKFMAAKLATLQMANGSLTTAPDDGTMNK